MIRPVLTAALLTAAYFAAATGVAVFIGRRLKRWAEARDAREHDARVLAIVCEPCTGGSGRCTCSSKCGHWLCGAADTGVMTIDDEYRALLRKETGRD